MDQREVSRYFIIHEMVVLGKHTYYNDYIIYVFCNLKELFWWDRVMMDTSNIMTGWKTSVCVRNDFFTFVRN